MHIGQIVHYEYGGKCNAAIISAFWEDQSLAQLTVFRAAGGMEWPVSRAEQGKHGDDKRWHTLAECPDVAVEGETAQPPAVSPDHGDFITGTIAAPKDIDPWGNPITPDATPKPKNKGGRPRKQRA